MVKFYYASLESAHAAGRRAPSDRREGDMKAKCERDAFRQSTPSQISLHSGSAVLAFDSTLFEQKESTCHQNRKLWHNPLTFGMFLPSRTEVECPPRNGPLCCNPFRFLLPALALSM